MGGRKDLVVGNRERWEREGPNAFFVVFLMAS